METPLETKPKIKQNRVKFLPSYTLHLDNDITLKIRPTANAWWRREARVAFLIAALSEGYKIPAACIRAGISLKQYKYFVKAHPEVTNLLKYYKANFITQAQTTVAKAVKTDKKLPLNI